MCYYICSFALEATLKLIQKHVYSPYRASQTLCTGTAIVVQWYFNVVRNMIIIIMCHSIFFKYHSIVLLGESVTSNIWSWLFSFDLCKRPGIMRAVVPGIKSLAHKRCFIFQCGLQCPVKSCSSPGRVVK